MTSLPSSQDSTPELLGCQTARISTVQPYETSLYDKAVPLLKKLNVNLDPWQEQVVRDSLGIKADGKFASIQVALIVARQNGKNFSLLARQLIGLFLLKEKAAHTAHEFTTAREHYDLLASVLRDAGFDDSKMKFRNSNSETSITFLATGSKLTFKTRTNDGGRGLAAFDVVYLDEAFALSEAEMGAIIPILSAKSTAGNPQIWITSSAGKAGSTVLKSIREDGINGTPGLSYWEWSAPEDADPNDRNAWAMANPALGRRLNASWIQDLELSRMSEEEFARERLGIWDGAASNEVISHLKWNALKTDSKIVGKIVVGIDISIDRSRAALTVCGLNTQGQVQLDLVAYDSGTQWLPEALADLAANNDIVRVIYDSYNGSQTLAVQELDLKPMQTDSKQMAISCGMFLDAVNQGTLRHTGKAFLDGAIAVTAKRPIGESGFGWKKRQAELDISPVVAATLAHYAWVTIQPELTKTKKPIRMFNFA